MRTFTIALLALVSLVISSGCCCCGGGAQHGCGFGMRHRRCNPCANPCGGGGAYIGGSVGNGCDPCSPGMNGGGYGGTYAPGNQGVIAPPQGTMLTPTTSQSAYSPSPNAQMAAVPLESLPTY